MNKRRLLKLADLLEADAKNKKGVRFDLRTVVDRRRKLPSANVVPVSCGTTACAMGLAAISGAFKRQGLSYRINPDYEDEIFIETTMRGVDREYDDAAIELFDISGDEAKFLFTPSCYPDRKLTGATGERYVAKRIRDFVAGKATAADA